MDNKSISQISRNIILILSACILLFTGCSLGADKDNLELSDFGFLREGISYHEIVSEVGPPDWEGGSGFHIIVYSLDDGKTVWLWFAELDHLLWAAIEDQEGVREDLELPIRPGSGRTAPTL